MANDDKLSLLTFIARTGMFIDPIDFYNVTSFITGYEWGRNECDFSGLIKDLLSTKYKIKYLSDGLAGQVRRLSVKQSLSQVITFKKIALETIALDGLTENMEFFLKSVVIDLINKINKAGHPWYNETWKDGWISLTSIYANWFKHLWTKKQWSIIKQIDKEIMNNNLYKAEGENIPSDIMLDLKYKFENCIT